jgi:hypothetical protein
MTPNQQRRFYFPLWQKVCQAQDWRLVQGRLLGPRQPQHGLAESTRLYNAVWDAAEILAASNHRAVTPDDLRHACHLVALFPGKAASTKAAPISSKDLSNRQLDRVATLFRILANPDDVDAAIAWSDPSFGDKKRLQYVIRKAAPFAYIDAICRDKFGLLYTSPFWEDLPVNDLRQLALTLRNRLAANSRPIDISKNSPQLETEPDPF